MKHMIEGITVSDVGSVVSLEELNRLKERAGEVLISDSLIAYAAECVDATREHERVQLGASPRALLAWVKAAKAYAFIEGREYVTPDDLKILAPYVLAHRLILTQHSAKETAGAAAVVQEILRKVRVPIGK